jgi:GntR family transcriptional regulator of vanillate catabolism
VKVLLLQDIWDSIEVRGLLEGGVARLAAERLVSERDVDGLRKIQQDMDAMGEPTIENFPADLDLNEVCHAEIVRLSRSEMLRQALDRLFSFPVTSPRVLVSVRPKMIEASEVFIISREHHYRIIDAITNRQGRARRESGARACAIDEAESGNHNGRYGCPQLFAGGRVDYGGVVESRANG